MIEIKGKYDGNKLTLEKALPDGEYEVILTVLSQEDSERDFSSFNSFEFWENDQEDIYNDYLQQK